MKKTNVLTLGELRYTDVQTVNDYVEQAIAVLGSDILQVSSGVILGLSVTQTASGSISVATGAIWLNRVYGQLENPSGIVYDGVTYTLPTGAVTRTDTVGAIYNQVLDIPGTGYVLTNVTTRVEQVQTNFTRKFGACQIIIYQNTLPSAVPSGVIPLATLSMTSGGIQSVTDVRTYVAAGVAQGLQDQSISGSSIKAASTPTANMLNPLDARAQSRVKPYDLFCYAGTGLNLNYQNGVAQVGGVPYTDASGSIALAPISTNYVFVNSSNVVAFNAAPTIPVGSITPSTTGGSLAAGNYIVVISLVNPSGVETVCSNESTQNIASGTTGSIAIALGALPTGWTGKLYMTTLGGASKSETFAATIPNSGSVTVTAVPAVGAATPVFPPANFGFLTDGNAVPLCTATTSISAITTVTDERAWLESSSVSQALATRMKDQVATQNDLRIANGVERIQLQADYDPQTRALKPRDSRITLSGPWVYSNGYGNGSLYGAPYANSMVPAQQALASLSTNIAGATITVNFDGTALVWMGVRDRHRGTFTVSIDGGPATTYDSYVNTDTASYSNGILIASGLTAGPHTAVLTVTGTKGGGGAADDAQVYTVAFDVLQTTDASARYAAGTSFPSGVQTKTLTRGTVAAPASIGTAPYQKGVYYTLPGNPVPQLVMSAAGNTSDTLSQFQAKNKIAFRAEAEDRSAKLANIWATADKFGTASDASNGMYWTMGGTTTTDFIIIGFVGTGLDLIYQQGTGNGIFAYSIDGGTETNFDCYATDVSFVRGNFAKNLPFGYHQFKIRSTNTKNTSSTGYNITVDAFDIYQPAAPGTISAAGTTVAGLPSGAEPLYDLNLIPAATDAAAGNAVITPTSPESGWVRHWALAEFVYVGTNWSQHSVITDTITGGSVMHNLNTNTTDTATLTFAGTQFRILALTGTGANGQFNVSIDGGANTLVSTASNPALNPGVVYTSPVLTAGVHSITVTTTNSYVSPATANDIWLDSIEIIPMPAQILDVRNLYAQDMTPVKQAIADHKLNDRHPTNHLFGLPANNSQTNSTVAAPIGTQYSFTTSGGALYMAASVTAKNTAASTNYLAFQVDGQTVGVIAADFNANTNMNINSAYTYQVQPGNHTVGLAMWTNSGTITMIYANLSVVEI